MKRMNKQINNILSDELGKLGAVSTSTFLSNWAYLGASVTAKFLPNNEFEVSKTVYSNANDFLDKAFNVLKNEGRILSDIGNESDKPIIGAIVGSGYWNLNPAVVIVTINSIFDDSISVTVYGIAKEGLIKQYAGEKAAKRIAEKLF